MDTKTGLPHRVSSEILPLVAFLELISRLRVVGWSWVLAWTLVDWCIVKLVPKMPLEAVVSLPPVYPKRRSRTFHLFPSHTYRPGVGYCSLAILLYDYTIKHSNDFSEINYK